MNNIQMNFIIGLAEHERRYNDIKKISYSLIINPEDPMKISRGIGHNPYQVQLNS
jgi:hypothetical protein